MSGSSELWDAIERVGLSRSDQQKVEDLVTKLLLENEAERGKPVKPAKPSDMADKDEKEPKPEISKRSVVWESQEIELDLDQRDPRTMSLDLGMLASDIAEGCSHLQYGPLMHNYLMITPVHVEDVWDDYERWNTPQIRTVRLTLVSEYRYDVDPFVFQEQLSEYNRRCKLRDDYYAAVTQYTKDLKAWKASTGKK